MDGGGRDGTFTNDSARAKERRNERTSEHFCCPLIFLMLNFRSRARSGVQGGLISHFSLAPASQAFRAFAGRTSEFLKGQMEIWPAVSPSFSHLRSSPAYSSSPSSAILIFRPRAQTADGARRPERIEMPAGLPSFALLLIQAAAVPSPLSPSLSSITPPPPPLSLSHLDGHFIAT